MATNLLLPSPVMIRACSGSGPPRKSSVSSSSNWWSPLFGWSSEPDYISSGSENKGEEIGVKNRSESDSDLGSKPAKSRFARGCFTEEKAKQLRMLTNETSSYHDVMYHSAIASRLASDFKNRSDR